MDDDMALEVVVPVEEKDVDSIALGKTIWDEITAGVGSGGHLDRFCSALLWFHFVPRTTFQRKHRRVRLVYYKFLLHYSSALGSSVCLVCI